MNSIDSILIDFNTKKRQFRQTASKKDQQYSITTHQSSKITRPSHFSKRLREGLQQLGWLLR